MKLPVDRAWSEYPLGTKAHAVGGGYWIRVATGWRWHCGDTFPTPGGDAYGKCIELPAAPKTILVTAWKHPSTSTALILAGAAEVTRAEASYYFFDQPEKLVGVEEQMAIDEFRALPEFEG